MNIQITKDKKNKTIIVVATVSPDVSKKDAVNTLKVIEYLNNNNIKFKQCLKEDYASNRNNKMSGQWIFATTEQKVVDKTPQTVVTSDRAKRTRKSSKSKDE